MSLELLNFHICAVASNKEHDEIRQFNDLSLEADEALSYTSHSFLGDFRNNLGFWLKKFRSPLSPGGLRQENEEFFWDGAFQRWLATS